MINRNIYLIGFMASGKTSVGRKLAARLNMEFIDLDQRIEEEERQSITVIFKEKGECYFREVESKVLRSFSESKSCLIALGGGTVCYSSNIDQVNQNGLSIYLKRSNMRLLGRLRQKRSKRPLIANLSDDELKAFIDDKMKERASFYEQAQLIIDADEFDSKNDLVQFIVEKMVEIES